MSVDNLFWRDVDEADDVFEVSDEVVDLSFRIAAERLRVDHAFTLASALQDQLGDDTCSRIGVHGVQLAGSGNGWIRPEQDEAEIALPKRARLVIRVHQDDREAVEGLSESRLQLGESSLRIGASSRRRLSAGDCLHARAICCDRDQPETEFMAQVAAELRRLGIDVARMICGRSGEIRTAQGSLFTRALLVADLKPEESVRLQQYGLGEQHLMGCGLFVPHKGIDPVFSAQER